MKSLIINDETPLSQLYVISEVPSGIPEKPMIAYCQLDKNVYLSDSVEWRKISTEAIQ